MAWCVRYRALLAVEIWVCPLDESQAIQKPGFLRSQGYTAAAGAQTAGPERDACTEPEYIRSIAQMDFLNPGMLGSQEFFRSEFATPVDTNGDKEAGGTTEEAGISLYLTADEGAGVARDLPDRRR